MDSSNSSQQIFLNDIWEDEQLLKLLKDFPPEDIIQSEQIEKARNQTVEGEYGVGLLQISKKEDDDQKRYEVLKQKYMEEIYMLSHCKDKTEWDDQEVQLIHRIMAVKELHAALIKNKEKQQVDAKQLRKRFKPKQQNIPNSVK